jgi:hypothetical protein
MGVKSQKSVKQTDVKQGLGVMIQYFKPITVVSFMTWAAEWNVPVRPSIEYYHRG